MFFGSMQNSNDTDFEFFTFSTNPLQSSSQRTMGKIIRKTRNIRLKKKLHTVAYTQYYTEKHRVEFKRMKEPKKNECDA